LQKNIVNTGLILLVVYCIFSKFINKRLEGLNDLKKKRNIIDFELDGGESYSSENAPAVKKIGHN